MRNTLSASCIFVTALATGCGDSGEAGEGGSSGGGSGSATEGVSTGEEPTTGEPFVAFPHLHRRYAGAQLFPFFRNRVMPSTRPDYVHHVESLGLSVQTNDVIEFHARIIFSCASAVASTAVSRSR